MRQLKIFVLGILFYILAIPIIESVSEIITTFLEIPKGKVSIPVLKISKEISELQIDLQKQDDSVAIGFRHEPEHDECYDDDYFDDKKKNAIKLGFHS
jgi:hypothetical protein